MFPYTSFVSHHRFRLCWFYNRSCYRASLRCLPPGKLFEMVTVSRPIIRKPAKNWKFYFHRRPQLVILARSRSHLVQFLAITHPQRYRSAITTRRILVFVGVSMLYFTGFTLLQFIGVPRRSLLQIDLHFHATVITVLLFVGSAILLRSLRRFAKESRQNEDDKGLRQLVVATLFLSAILIACSLAHIITLNIWFYTELETPQDTLHLLAAMTIADEMLFIKVAADAFVYAWRLPYYRKSLKLVLTRAGRQIGKEATEMVTMAWLLLILTINI